MDIHATPPSKAMADHIYCPPSSSWDDQRIFDDNSRLWEMLEEAGEVIETKVVMHDDLPSSLTVIPEPTPFAPWVTGPLKEAIVLDPSGESDADAPNQCDRFVNTLTLGDSGVEDSPPRPNMMMPTVVNRFAYDDRTNVIDHDDDGQVHPRKILTKFAAPPERRLQDAEWNVRFQELLRFRVEYGHLFVPSYYPPNPKLPQWVKRQRYQRRLKERGIRSTMTQGREQILLDVGFIWDSHQASWQLHFESYKRFVALHGHDRRIASESCLSTWCKQQRKQYRLMMAGLPSRMTSDRMKALDSVGFDWCPRDIQPR